MQRRSFLYNSGILIPAALLVKPSGWLSSGKIQLQTILVTDASLAGKEKIAAIVRSAANTVEEIANDRIEKITYSPNGFSVSTTDGKIYTSAKIVFYSSYEIDRSKKIVQVKTDAESLPMQYNSGRNKEVVRPQFWTSQAERISKNDMLTFIKRKKHGFMCIC